MYVDLVDPEARHGGASVGIRARPFAADAQCPEPCSRCARCGERNLRMVCMVIHGGTPEVRGCSAFAVVCGACAVETRAFGRVERWTIVTNDNVHTVNESLRVVDTCELSIHEKSVS